MAEYAAQRCPLAVSFRQLAVSLPHPERATHLIHPHPAKLLAHIPYYFLDNSVFSSPGQTVLDPFCGSGTVLLESILAGRNALGIDANPLSRLISAVKVRPLDVESLNTELRALVDRIPNCTERDAPDVVNLHYWFYPQAVSQLRSLLGAILQTADADARNFFRVCFSYCAKKVSLADPRLSVPVRLRRDQYPIGHPFSRRTQQLADTLANVDVVSQFTLIAESNIRRMGALNKLQPKAHASVIGSDARALKDESGTMLPPGSELPTGSIDLILTSPPYAGSQKYIRASSLSLGWLGLCRSSELRALEDANIGREHFPKRAYESVLPTGIDEADSLLAEVREENPLRAHLGACYLVEMGQALAECCRVLKPEGFMVLVVGNTTMCGRTFDTQLYIRILAEDLGFTTKLVMTDNIRSRQLMTKRNSTAAMIAGESVVIFKKRAQARSTT